MPATTVNNESDENRDPLSSFPPSNSASSSPSDSQSTTPLHDPKLTTKVSNSDTAGLQQLSSPVVTHDAGNCRDGVNAELLEASNSRLHGAFENDDEGGEDGSSTNDENYSSASDDNGNDEEKQADDTSPKPSALSNFLQVLKGIYNSQLGWVHGKQTVRHWKPVIRSAISAWVSCVRHCLRTINPDDALCTYSTPSSFILWRLSSLCWLVPSFHADPSL